MRPHICERNGCTAPAGIRRVLRLGDREWTLRLCRHHAVILSVMISGWVRGIEQDEPRDRRHLAPTGPPAETPGTVLEIPYPELPAQPRRGALPPASPRARTRLRVVSEEGVQDG